jgi:hypothetical protein
MSDMIESSSSSLTMTDLAELRKQIECDCCQKVNPSKRCSRCRGAYYCSNECQKADWNNHKLVCQSRDEQTIFTNRVQKIAQSKPISQKQEQLHGTCSICLHEPMVNPVVLPDCHHAFCYTCLAEWQKSSMQCPNCRETTQMSVMESALDNATTYFAEKGLLEMKRWHNHSQKNTSSDSSDDMSKASERDENDNTINDHQNMYLNLALDQVNRVLRSNPNDVQALRVKGQILLVSKPIEALDLLEKADAIIEEDPTSNATKARNLIENIMVGVQSCEAMISLDKISQALDTYKVLERQVSKLNGNEHQEVVHYLILMGETRCLLQMKEFQRSKCVAECAIRLNRRHPGLHMMVAMSQFALGEKNHAVRTMCRGVLYEAPWNTANQVKNLEWLQRFSK